jgi:hypothetical protein
MRSPRLGTNDRTLISSLFRKVRIKNEKFFIHGRYFDPSVTRYDAKYGDDNEAMGVKSMSATFFTLPYFSLKKFWSHEGETVKEIHPVRTLLQTHFELMSTKSRDKHQVLMKSGALQNGIHVPQLWCLLLNNGSHYFGNLRLR